MRLLFVRWSFHPPVMGTGKPAPGCGGSWLAGDNPLSGADDPPLVVVGDYHPVTFHIAKHRLAVHKKMHSQKKYFQRSRILPLWKMVFSSVHGG